MPRREKDRELARRRKRKKERTKLRKKGLLSPSTPKEVGKKPEKASVKEAPKAASEPSTPEG